MLTELYDDLRGGARPIGSILDGALATEEQYEVCAVENLTSRQSS